MKELSQPRTLENFKIQLLSWDLSVSTVRRVIDGAFSAMIRDAKKFDGLVIDDPFIVIEWPETPREKPDPFTEAECDAILSYFRQRAAERKILFADYVFVYSLFWTGMRPSEAIALRWGDVDLSIGKAEITKSRHLGAEAFSLACRGLRKSQEFDHSRSVRLLPVFRDAVTKPFDAAQWRKRHWNQALRVKEIRPRKFYATRLTYISVALSHSVNIKWLSEQCGTSVEIVERNYGRHIRDDGDAPLRALLEAQTETLTPKPCGGSPLRPNCKLLKRLEPPAGVEPATY